MSRAPLPPLLVGLVGLVVGPQAAWARPRVEVSTEGGSELDSNPRRVNAPIEGSGAALLRIALDGAATFKPTGAQRLQLRYGAGGKLFLSEVGRPADELVQRGSASWSVHRGRGLWSASGHYYDAFQRASASLFSPWDFRHWGAGGGFARPLGAIASLLDVQLAYRGLHYKPAPRYGYHAAALAVDLRRRFERDHEGAHSEWSLGANYASELRGFGGAAVKAVTCPLEGQEICVEDADRARWDLAQGLAIEATYLGAAVGTLTYRIELNRSNSYGESYLRHALGLQFTATLGWRLFLSAKAILQWSRFADRLFSQVASQRFTEIEDENRSQLSARLARALDDRWSVALRYGAYVNEAATTATGEHPPGFLRHTLFLSMRYEYDSAE